MGIVKFVPTKQGGKKAKILCPFGDFSRYETQDTSSQVKKQ